MNEPNEPSIRELLRAELRADENDAPDFDAVWSAAVMRHHRDRTRAIIARIGALAAVIALAFLVTPAFHSVKIPPAIASGDLPWRSAVLLTEWRAPTDALLPAAESFPFHN